MWVDSQCGVPQASPPAFCPDSRTRDLDAILSAIRDAQEFIHVSVMEYYPASKYAHQHGWVLGAYYSRAEFSEICDQSCVFFCTQILADHWKRSEAFSVREEHLCSSAVQLWSWYRPFSVALPQVTGCHSFPIRQPQHSSGNSHEYTRLNFLLSKNI